VRIQHADSRSDCDAGRYAGGMPNPLARALSILGHPLLLLPAASLLLAAHDGADAVRLSGLAFALGVSALVVMAWSWWQVRRRRWQHVDASTHGERRALNRFLLTALAVASATLWLWTTQRELALGMALSALLIVVAMLSSRWCRLSLHVAFAMYAATLLAQVSWIVLIVGLLLAIAVAWSRLALSRHAPRDLVAGAIAGTLAGLLFRQLLPAVAG
jgi:membrane-associated phospholipid phosphatase